MVWAGSRAALPARRFLSGSWMSMSRMPAPPMRLASLIVLAILLPRPAAAYPWMIRHDYTGCTPCHADPSGAGLITAYGRAQGELLLRTRWSGKTDEEPGKIAQFAFGLIP